MRNKGTAEVRGLLQDIVTWGERLTGHVAGLTEAEFLANPLVQDAACRCVEVLGEASRRLMEAEPGIEDRLPELTLRQAYGARNRLAHVYDGIDYGIVWAAAQQSVPRMVAAARAALDA